MASDGLVLTGRYVRMEAMGPQHAVGLAEAAASGRAMDAELYRWSTIPEGVAEFERYCAAGAAERAAGASVPMVTVRVADEMVLGSSRFFNFDRWAWPVGHERFGREFPDGCEIGYTWLGAAGFRTPANTEAKMLMLAHAFERWDVFRVCLHADARNVRSRLAMERIGATFEGILRAHRMAAEFISRDSARYSIVAGEWAGVRRGLVGRLG